MASASSTQTSPSSDQREEPMDEKQRFHKIKRIRFLDRSTPIILENESGACPLVAICNVLLLENQLLNVQRLENQLPKNQLFKDLWNLSYKDDISQEKLLELVTYQMIHTVEKETEYSLLQIKEHNITKGIEFLPHLTTEIDFNIKFGSISDFDCKSGRAIFDLLKISLYHGWLVDPKDNETAYAIGSKSYSTIIGDLIALLKEVAASGVPSSSLSRPKPSDDSPPPLSSSSPRRLRKGDAMEAAQLLRILKLSLTETSRQQGSGYVAPKPSDCVENQNTYSHQNLDKLVSSIVSSISMVDVYRGEYTPSRESLSQINEGDKCVIDYSTLNPVYQGDGILAEQADISSRIGPRSRGSKDKMTPQEVELISNFLMKTIDSQLTSHGLFSLQESLQERELCVFVRKNQFRPMLKFDGHLYILVTDLAFLNQPDLVWAKLEDGDSMFMTSDFKEFNLSNLAENACFGQNAVACGTDRLQVSPGLTH